MISLIIQHSLKWENLIKLFVIKDFLLNYLIIFQKLLKNFLIYIALAYLYVLIFYFK